jgi:pimeloyl-ACP methyl ester carboxylesterase
MILKPMSLAKNPSFTTGPASIIAVTLLLALVPCAALQAAPAESALELSPCELHVPGTGLTAPAECGWFEVAENPAEPEGRKIKLRVARVPAQGREVEPDPLILFAGGPGQAATEAWLIVAPAFRKLNENRDILLIDQRGTGQSNPLRCRQIALDEAMLLDWDDLEDSTRDCLAGLQGDPRFYTTTIAMQDYDQVRAALGYEQLNLFGVSYGTRAAQVYLRLFPERVRTVVLDSVVPQTLALGSEHAKKLDLALDRVLDSCEADADCRQAFPQSRENLRLMAEAVTANPVKVTVLHPLTGEPQEVEFNRDLLGGAIRFLSYSAETQALLPLLIHEAATTGNYSRITSQLMITATGLADSIAQGMELSVVCAEDFPRFPNPDEMAESTNHLLSDSMMRSSQIQCGIWPRGSVPADFNEPIVSDKPILLLSGEFDPVTPPEYAEQVLQHLSNGKHLVAPGQGHSVSGKGCLGRLVSEFIVAADHSQLDTACIAQLQASPWFMTLTGPQP